MQSLTCSASMFPMKNLKQGEPESVESWLTPLRVKLVHLLAYTGMSSFAITALLHGLKTETQTREMGRFLITRFDETGKMPTPDEVMLGMLSIRRTGKFSLTAWAEPTGRNTTRKTRRRAD